jgi:hypothetical protein
MLKIQQQTAPQLEEEKKLPAMTTSTSRQNIHRSISFSTHVPFVQFVCNHLFVERAGRVCLEEPDYSCHMMTMTWRCHVLSCIASVIVSKDHIRKNVLVQCSNDETMRRAWRVSIFQSLVVRIDRWLATKGASRRDPVCTHQYARVWLCQLN